MASLINRIQRAFNGSAGPDKIRALLAELAIPAGGSGENALRAARRGLLRPISDEAILRNALGSLNLTGSGTSSRSLTKIRSGIFHNRHDSETTLREGLNDLLESGDLAGGGGGTPAWVPEDAVIHIDLVGGSPQGRAWVEGTGEVDVDTLLGTDPDTESGWGTTSYDEEELTSEGYVTDIAGPVAFIGAAKTKILAGSTIVFEIGLQAEGGALALDVISSTGGDYVEFGIKGYNNRDAFGFSNGGSYSEEIAPIGNSLPAPDYGRNKLAITLTPTRGEFAANGANAVGDALTTDDYPTVGEDALIAALWTCPALRAVTFYDALPSTTGLSALSEIDVTNTAPTSLTAQWVTVTEIDPTHATISAASAADPFQVLEVLTLIDAEGNPAVWTLTDDDGGNFEVVPFNQVFTTQGLEAGVHNFTVRGTEPGGLYIEQEFTVTVTA